MFFFFIFRFEPLTVIIREGDYPLYFYLILSGSGKIESLKQKFQRIVKFDSKSVGGRQENYFHVWLAVHSCIITNQENLDFYYLEFELSKCGDNINTRPIFNYIFILTQMEDGQHKIFTDF